MFPVYMIAYVLLVSLAFAVLSAVFLRRLDGGKELPWPRLGGMLTAMVLVKAYIVYSQYMITWYASIPAEMSFYNAAASTGWSGMFAAALVLQRLHGLPWHDRDALRRLTASLSNHNPKADGFSRRLSRFPVLQNFGNADKSLLI